MRTWGEYCAIQGAAADDHYEPAAHGTTARQRIAGSGHAQLLPPVPPHVHRRPGVWGIGVDVVLSSDLRIGILQEEPYSWRPIYGARKNL